MRTTLVFVLITTISYTYSWKLPDLPSGKRSQYFLLHNDGGYKYGYDTNQNYFAKQTADANNEVSGHYIYKDITGKDVDVKYTSGVKGFVPENLKKLLPKSGGPNTPYQSFAYPSFPSSEYSKDDQTDTGDASYSFNIDTDNYKRQESSDARGNVQGRYSYINEAGHHDLSYIAGSKTGFIATSGSLSQPNGLGGRTVPVFHSLTTPKYINSDEYSTGHNIINPDGSYSFGFTTNEQSRQENADSTGNVQGRYVFTNEAGTHDLNYIAGPETGFRATGGSLAIPNGLTNSRENANGEYYYTTTDSTDRPQDFTTDQANTGDASYSFSIDTDEYKRQESSDANGNIKGSYSYKNAAGQHDLSFVAGSETGFVATGGSLSIPNGLTDKQQYSSPLPSFFDSSAISSRYSQNNKATVDDASYDFSIDTPDYQRQETSDVQGNIKGRYSYQNDAGSHDLNYIAGANTGFVAKSGSLAVPNGISNSLPFAESLVSPLYSPSAGVSERKVDNVVLKTYYPSKSQSKYGYIYESI